MAAGANFSDQFAVSVDAVDVYGAFDVSLASDIPLFIDPFLLFASEKPEYQKLHAEILRYLTFLRDRAIERPLSQGELKEWFFFKEVKQTWLGFTFMNNAGRGLGADFAQALQANFGALKGDSGSAHLERISLFTTKIGRDGISDFTTNLIKQYLLEYTAEFARQYVDDQHLADFHVARTRFDYVTETWLSHVYRLPALDGDFVLLTPIDMLTKDETWINPKDLRRQAQRVVAACDDAQLRTKVDRYIQRKLAQSAAPPGQRPPPPPTDAERRQAAVDAISAFPDLIDIYVDLKERDGEKAAEDSRQKVLDAYDVFVSSVRSSVQQLGTHGSFYDAEGNTYDEALKRVRAFKHYIEHQDGYRVIHRKGKPLSDESEVQLFFGLIWYGTKFDVNREPNNGRGPVDFKVSYGRGDKALVELKLASNSSLRRNLENQVAVYEAANQTKKSVKLIVAYTAAEIKKVERMLNDLGMAGDPSVVVVDARNDNKPSASLAGKNGPNGVAP